jgi:transposase
VGASRRARPGRRRLTRATGRGRPARLVARDHRRVAGRSQKGGAKVARSLHGKPASRYQLAVAGNGPGAGAPLEVSLEAGNLPDQRQLLPLVDELIDQGIHPNEVWADRGYDSADNRQGLQQRQIQPQISRRRRRGQSIPAGSPTREVWRGRKRSLKTLDPNGRHRWPVERTNAWLKARRRIATRRERKPDNYLAFLRLGMILILARSF